MADLEQEPLLQQQRQHIEDGRTTSKGSQNDSSDATGRSGDNPEGYPLTAADRLSSSRLILTIMALGVGV